MQPPQCVAGGRSLFEEQGWWVWGQGITYVVEAHDQPVGGTGGQHRTLMWKESDRVGDACGFGTGDVTLIVAIMLHGLKNCDFTNKR